MAAKDVSWSVQFFQVGDKQCGLDITELLEAWVVADFQDKGREGKGREGKYLLDLQRIGGPSFCFLELCSSFLTKSGAL
jgi:hypothetical protein